MEKLKRFNVNIVGAGHKTLMFSHGLGCSQRMWRHIYPALEQEYKIVLFDLMGSGESDIEDYDEKRYESLEGYAEDVLEIATALQLKDITFIGHSVSSMIGMIAAIKSPELFAHLVMLAPSPCYINEKNYVGGFERHEVAEVLRMMRVNMSKWAELFCPQFMGGNKATKLSDELRASFCKTDHEITCRFAEVTFYSDYRSQLSQLLTPTLILQGTDDIVAPVEVGNFMSKRIPHNTVRYLASKGHFAHLVAPEETAEIIKEYLTSEDEKFPIAEGYARTAFNKSS